MAAADGAPAIEAEQLPSSIGSLKDAIGDKRLLFTALDYQFAGNPQRRS
jgi:hypothetical protein